MVLQILGRQVSNGRVQSPEWLGDCIHPGIFRSDTKPTPPRIA